MNRKCGYYWVKYNGEWGIAKWYEYFRNRFQWDYFGITRIDYDFDEIDERIIERR